jgi:hypothetical protein
MTKDEALKLALEALETKGEHHPRVYQAIAVIKEALAQPEQAPMNYYRADAEGNLERTDIHSAQPEQEPLEYWNAVEGWVKIDEVREHFDSVGCGTIYKTAGEGREPLYTTPPQRTWVGLTNEDDIDWQEGGNLKDLVKAIEAKLKAKNS